jgi:HPt (histidine-containing phosphotransfer) domain-containing protein
MEEGVVEQSAVEKEISDKAREWIEEYGEDFLVDLIDVYLEDTPNRIAQMRGAVGGGETDTLIREAHTLKSSSANVGAMRLSALAKQMEFAWRSGDFAGMADDVQRFQDEFIQVKAALEALKSSPAEFVSQER